MSHVLQRCSLVGIPCLLMVSAAIADDSVNVLMPVAVQSGLSDPAELAKFELQREQALTPGGVTVISAEDLRERNVVSIGDMLRYVPGVWTATGGAGDTTFLSSRGSNLDATNFDGNGIKLLIDGLPVTAADGNNHNSFIDPLAARHAVIARGANGMNYGASTLGGAIDFISPTARTTNNEVYLSGGSQGTVQSRITGGVVEGEWDALVTVEQRSYDGFRDQQQQQRGSVYANTGWQISDTVENRFYLTYVDNNQQLPGALTRAQFDEDPFQANPANVPGNFQLNVEKWRAANRTEWRIDDSSRLVVGFSYENQSLFHPIVENPFFSLLIDNDQATFGSSVRYDRQWGNHELLLGLNYAETTVKGGNFRHSGGIRGDLATRVNNSADNLAVFATDRWHLADRWTLVIGAQAVTGRREIDNLDVNSGERRNPSDTYRAFNPRLGVIYQLADSSQLFANVSRLYEAPTLYELEDDAQANNDTLKAMQGVVAEIGTRGTAFLGRDNAVNWELAVYYAQIEDEILSVENPDEPGTNLTTNIDNTIHAGVEALIGGSFLLGSGAHRIEPIVSLTYNRFNFDDDPLFGTNQLPVAPRFFIKGEIMYRHINGFFAGPTVDIVDDRFADFSNNTKVSGYELFGLRTGINRDRWELFVEGRNLTDKVHVANLRARPDANANDALLQAGEPRSVFAGLRYDF